VEHIFSSIYFFLKKPLSLLKEEIVVGRKKETVNSSLLEGEKTWWMKKGRKEGE